MALVNIAGECIEARLPCPVCKADGQITDEHAKRIASGRIMRDARVARMESLRESAARMNITPVALSAIERGDL